MIGAILSWLTGNGFRGALDRALDTIDNKIEAETDREKIKADIIRQHMTTRGEWLRAGGFWTLAAFAVPALFHFGAVTVYSVFWCADCAYPKAWTIAALPAPMSEWQGWIVLASIGGLSLLGVRR